MFKSIAGIGLVALICSTPVLAIDLERFWEGRCSECHGHAGAFARRHLSVSGGRLVSKNHPDLQAFLAAHEAGAAQAKGIYELLLAHSQSKAAGQSADDPVYRAKCAGCHDDAAGFARSSLALRDGVVIGRDNGQPISEFLKRHGRLGPAEVPVVVESLTRLLEATGGGAR